MAQASISLRRMTDDVIDAQWELLNIYEQVEEAKGELTPEMEERLDKVNERLDAMNVSIEQKIDGIVAVIKDREHMAKGMTEEADTLLSRARTHQNTANRLKNYLLYQLQKLDQKRFETLRSDIRRQLNGQPSLSLAEDVKRIPKWCVKVIPEQRRLDSRAALKELREAGKIPDEAGTYEVTHNRARFIVTRGEHLRIK